MGPPLYMQSVIDQNIGVQHMTVVWTWGSVHFQL